MDLRIKEVIKEKGMTITELADKMGINRVAFDLGAGKDAP